MANTPGLPASLTTSPSAAKPAKEVQLHVKEEPHEDKMQRLREENEVLKLELENTKLHAALRAARGHLQA